MNRGIVIAAALGLSAAELAVSLWYPVPVYVASGCGATVALVVGLAAAWRRNRRPPAALLVDERDRSFRTPVYANGLLMGLACLQILVFFLAVIRETWVGLLGAGLFAVLLAGQWRALRYGHGLTLRPSGIEAAKSAGILIIPWEALAVEQPGRGDNWWEIRLGYARPDLVTVTGWVHERTVVVFEGADPDFVAAAIATYAAEPARRHAIGTRVELERLQAGMSGPLRGIARIVEPASTGTNVRRLVVGLVLFLGASAVAGVTDGWWEVLAMPFGWAGAHQIYLAVAGWRAGWRARRMPVPVEASTAPGRRVTAMASRDVNTAAMSVGELFVAALTEVEQDDGEHPLPYLVALHERGSREVFDAAAALLDSPDELRRELGIRVLRELGAAGADGRRPHGGETVALLRSRLHAETAPGVLRWVVSALGYHSASQAIDEVLALAAHPHPAVRFHVAAALPSLVDPRQAQDTAVAALQRLCRDDDADTRWYAFYALTQETTGVAAQQIRTVAQVLIDDPDRQIRDLAMALPAVVAARALIRWCSAASVHCSTTSGSRSGRRPPPRSGSANE